MRVCRGVTMFTLALACTSKDAQQRAAEPDEALQTDLRTRVAEDQAMRERFVAQMQATGSPDSALVAKLRGIDSANTRWLRALVERDGWPTRARVGKEGLNAAFLLVQHADEDTAFQAWVLPHVERAFRAGEMEGQAFALLTDRLASARGTPQEFGTQTDFRGGRIIVQPIRDSANVDVRRAAVGLPPMAEYLRVLDSVYFQRPTK